MPGSLLLRLLGVAAFSAAPVAALETAPTPEILTGDAIGSPEEGGFQNTGGNFQLGELQSDSKTVIGDPAAAPPSILAVPPVVLPKNPGADAVARARALVEDAKARAQAQIDAARAAADRAVAEAKRDAEAAQARAQQQSDAARANAAAASARSNP